MSSSASSGNFLYISNTAEIRLSLKPIKTDPTFQKPVCKDALSAHKYHFSRYTWTNQNKSCFYCRNAVFYI